MFIFKFEKLLNIKTKLLEEKRIKLAAIEKEIDKKRKEKMQLENDNILRRKKIFNILTSDKPDTNLVMFLEENVERVDRTAKQIESEIEELTKKKIELIKIAEELLKEKKKLERLKEKRFFEYKENLKKQEVKFLDEIASIKVAHKRINHI